MAYVITDRCTRCGQCLDVCPIGAISEGDPRYVIDDTCCDFAECVVVCPEEAIVELGTIESGGEGLDAQRGRTGS